MARSAPTVPLFGAAVVGALVGVAFHPPVLAAILLCCGAGALACQARSAAAQAFGVMCVAFSLSLTLATHAIDRHAARAALLPPRVAVFEGIADDVSLTRTGSTRVALQVTGVVDGDTEGRPLSVRLEVFAPPGADRVAPGDRVRVRGLARPPAPADLPGELDGALLALARDVDARVSARAPSAIAVMERGAYVRPFSTARGWLSERIRALVPEREAGLLLALLVGDTALLSDEQRALYRNVGAGHLLAVSGLQVSLLALILRALLVPFFVLLPGGRVGRGTRNASLVSVACVWAFVLVCGAPPSAVRAGAMATAVLAAGLFERRVRALDAIGIAGLFTVLVSPTSVVDPSFLLSYGAVIGLALVPRAEPGDEPSLWASLRTGVLATLAASLVTLPISAFLFGQVSLGGALANVVLVPAASLLQVPALGLGALGAVLDSGALVHLGAEAALLLEALVAGLDAWLGGTRYLMAPSAVVTCALVAGVIAVLVALGRRKLTPAIAIAAAMLAVVAFQSRTPEGVRISVVPIGQGDATLFELPDGKTILVDGGGVLVGTDPGDSLLVPFLRRKGLSRIDVLVLSHPHPDHGNGLVAVVRAFSIGELWHNGAPADDPVLAPLLGALPAETRVRTTPALLGDHHFGDVTVAVLGPAPVERTPQYPELSANDNSLVLRVCLATTCALWPGDVEALGEGLLLESAAAGNLGAALVKAGHHGSDTSSTDAFVRATGARHVVFCTGRDNAFSFPHAEVIERWQRVGAHTWDTAVHGLISATLTPQGVKIRGLHDGAVTAPHDG